MTAALLLAAALAACAQEPAVPNGDGHAYVLGPDDVISVRALHMGELAGHAARLDASGYVRLPVVGRVRAAGRTIEELEREIAARLAPHLREPDVVVSVTEPRTYRFSVIGAVRSPGVREVRGTTTLVEAVALAGGIEQDAGHTLRITRRLGQGRIPLPGAREDAAGGYSVAFVDVKALLGAGNPAGDLAIAPHDVIAVPRGELVYVVGEVRKPGGFVLRDRDGASVLQALALAEGLDRGAAPERARILRPSGVSARREEIRIDLKRILSGKAPDARLLPDDVLFVPGKTVKPAVLRTLENLANVGAAVAMGGAIYR